jgi:hypothetical protein
VKIDSTLFYQVFYKGDEGKKSSVKYINTRTNKEWINGNTEYAVFLANNFKGKFINSNQVNCCEMDIAQNAVELENSKVLKTEDVSAFEKREYGFAFKRLPVVKVSYDTPDEMNLYIETATSRLAARVGNKDRYEGYSFAILHKFLLLDWAGKNSRDIVMMISALGVFSVSVLGLLLYLKK